MTMHTTQSENSKTVFSVGNRVDDPLQKVGSSSPAVACKNTVTPLPRHCWYGCGEEGVVKG